jgi:hypothetical protein
MENAVIILGYTNLMCVREQSVKYNPFSSKRHSSYREHRLRMWESQNHRCYWCNRKCVIEGDGGSIQNQFTVDHVIPLSVGGTSHWMNLVGSCRFCNKMREIGWSEIRMIPLVISQSINTNGDITNEDTRITN